MLGEVDGQQFAFVLGTAFAHDALTIGQAEHTVARLEA